MEYVTKLLNITTTFLDRIVSLVQVLNMTSLNIISKLNMYLK